MEYICYHISVVYVVGISLNISLKQIYGQIDDIFIISCTVYCHFENFLCNQWQQVHQYDDIFILEMDEKFQY